MRPGTEELLDRRLPEQLMALKREVKKFITINEFQELRESYNKTHRLCITNQREVERLKKRVDSMMNCEAPCPMPVPVAIAAPVQQVQHV